MGEEGRAGSMRGRSRLNVEATTFASFLLKQAASVGVALLAWTLGSRV